MKHLTEDWKKNPCPLGFIPDEDRMVWIVCAANRTEDGVIFCGARHGSAAMYSQMKAAGIAYHETEDGFIDQYDRWWSREQAYEIMKITGQPMSNEGAWGEVLYSENLYEGDATKVA